MKNKENKRSKASCILLSAIFIGYVAAYTLGTFLIKDRDFSEMENRRSQSLPPKRFFRASLRAVLRAICLTKYL